MEGPINTKAWWAIYRALADNMTGGQDEVARAASEIYFALIGEGLLKKRGVQ
jgi:hypothetical protein